MFSRRFFPYIVVIGVVMLLVVSYFGIRTYRRHVEFERFISNAQAVIGSLDSHHDSSPPVGRHTHGGRNHLHSPFSEEGMGYSDLSTRGQFPSSADGHSGISMHDMFMDWIETGKKSDAMEAFIKESQANNPFRGKVIQRVVSPHGQIHTVLVPEGYEYQEGDAILRSELDPPAQVFSFGGDPMSVTLEDGVTHEVPEEYYSIADPYERRAYLKKFAWSIENDVSMAEVEKKVSAGELDFSLSEVDKKDVDQEEEQLERAQWLSDQFAKPLPPDRPPVKVRYLPDEDEDALPGWMRKLERNPQSRSGEAADSGEYSGTDFVSEGDFPVDTDTAPVGSDVPRSPSDSPDTVKPTPSSPSVADLEKQLAPVGIKAELSQGVSSDSFDKAQQLIDEYGTEEGLRRLREMDPEAARRFERERRGEPSREVPSGDTHPDGHDAP